LDPVSPAEIPVSANKDGDIGFHLCNTDACLNWRYALTNKFIEYNIAGLPIITSNTLEQSNILKRYKNGWVLPSNDQRGIEAVLKCILNERAYLSEMSSNSLKAGQELFSWDKYKSILHGVILNDQHIIKENENNVVVNREQLLEWDREDKRNEIRVAIKNMPILRHLCK